MVLWLVRGGWDGGCGEEMGESRLFISVFLFSRSLLRETGFLLSSRLSNPSAPG